MLEPPVNHSAYPTYAAAREALDAKAKSQGYALRVQRTRNMNLVTSASDPDVSSLKDGPPKQWLMCVRGGHYSSQSRGVRSGAGSIRSGCKFLLVLTYVQDNPEDRKWVLTVLEGSHNHDASDPQRLSQLRNRDQDTRLRIRVLYALNWRPKAILRQLQEEGRVITIKDVYCERAASKKMSVEEVERLKAEMGLEMQPPLLPSSLKEEAKDDQLEVPVRLTPKDMVEAAKEQTNFLLQTFDEAPELQNVPVSKEQVRQIHQALEAATTFVRQSNES